MSIPSIETDHTSSTIIDDDMSIVVNDSSDTTVTTGTSASWHSVESDEQINNNLALRSHSISTWLKKCLIEPDIRLTTAQEWKLRTCMRRLLSLCNLPLKISCIKIEESIPYIDQPVHQTWLSANEISNDRLEQLGLYLHILSIADTNNNLLEVKLVEFHSEKSQNRSIIPISLIKSPKFLFHISSNILQLNLRSINSLLELRFSTREHEPIRGKYYQWNDTSKEHRRLNTIVHIDHSLINELNRI